MELAGMLMNWMSGTTVTPSLDSPSPLIRTESSRGSSRVGCGPKLHPVDGDLQLEGYRKAGRQKLSSDVHPVCCCVGELASSKDRVG